MSLSQTMFYKVIGKIELSSEESGENDTYYMIQWNNNSGPITIQNRASISSYNTEIAKFERKSTLNHFYDRTRERSNIDFIENDQAAFLIDILKQYGEKKDKCDDNAKLLGTPPFSMDSPVNEEMILNLNHNCLDNSVEIEKNSTNLLDNKIFEKDDSSDDFSDVPHYGLFKADESSSSEKSSVNDNCNTQGKDMNTSVNMDVEASKENIGNDFEMDDKSSESGSYKDFSDLEDTMLELSYAQWEKNIIDMVQRDGQTSKENNDWGELELVSFVNSDSKTYYIAYNTTTHLMSLVEECDIPYSQRYKLNDLIKAESGGK